MLSAFQTSHHGQTFDRCWSWRVTTTLLMIEKQRFSAYSTFKTFSFGFKIYFNFVVIEFWLVVLLDWTIIFEIRYSGMVPLFHTANSFSILKWCSSSYFCVNCSSSTSCYFECVFNFLLIDCLRFVKRIKVVSRFVSLFLPVEIIRVILYFVICFE